MGNLAHYPGCAGADEAGRGPLAGPVVAAAVILPENFNLEGIDDSKKLDASIRNRLAIRIRETAIFCVEISDMDEIERLNILHASMAAMARAIRALPVQVSKVYVDGNRLPPNLPCPGEAVVKGDGKVASIAAASILAKTVRDALMVNYAVEFPGYGFERHFGYGTPEHLDALARLGPCLLHRRSFGPVKAFFQPCLIFDE
jgi:ribonuclease HII